MREHHLRYREAKNRKMRITFMISRASCLSNDCTSFEPLSPAYGATLPVSSTLYPTSGCVESTKAHVECKQRLSLHTQSQK